MSKKGSNAKPSNLEKNKAAFPDPADGHKSKPLEIIDTIVHIVSAVIAVAAILISLRTLDQMKSDQEASLLPALALSTDKASANWETIDGHNGIDFVIQSFKPLGGYYSLSNDSRQNRMARATNELSPIWAANEAKYVSLSIEQCFLKIWNIGAGPAYNVQFVFPHENFTKLASFANDTKNDIFGKNIGLDAISSNLFENVKFLSYNSYDNIDDVSVTMDMPINIMFNSQGANTDYLQIDISPYAFLYVLLFSDYDYSNLITTKVPQLELHYRYNDIHGNLFAYKAEIRVESISELFEGQPAKNRRFPLKKQNIDMPSDVDVVVYPVSASEVLPIAPNPTDSGQIVINFAIQTSSIDPLTINWGGESFEYETYEQ